MALLSEDVPERDRATRKREAGESQFFHPVLQFGIVVARLADSGEIALHIGGENGHADAAEAFRHHLQRDGLARARGSGDQTVAIRHAGQQVQRIVPLGDQKRVCHEILRGSELSHSIVR